MVPAQVKPGDVLAGKYRVERVLGQGNMGVVVAASHVDLAQRVALKFMLPGAAAQKEHRERFLREARASVRLKSQHVARVLDVGTLDGETPYIVMELLEGSDLAALLSRSGPLPFATAVDHVLQACEAVAEAHAAGIVHRDLKPANLFLTHDVGGAPCIKVLDFGISKSTGVDLTLTQDAQALGSPLYMSPEQMNSSRDVDPRSDIWALGIVLYQLVAGVTPFHADTIQGLCARVLMGAPTPLAELRPDAPPGFEAVVLRCIERDRERRFRNVAELAAALAPFATPAAIGYVQRVARVLGVPAPAPEAAASVAAPAPGATTGAAMTGGAAVAVTSAPSSTVVMASPVSGAAGPAGALPQTGSPLIHASGSGAYSAMPAGGAVASTTSGLAASGAPIDASQRVSVPAEAAARKLPLVLAAAGGALVVALLGVVALRPWESSPSPSAEPATAGSTAAAPGPSTAAPEVHPVRPAVPAATSAGTDAPAGSSAPTPTLTVLVPPSGLVPLRPAATVKPGLKPPLVPTSKPGVSYDDRR